MLSRRLQILLDEERYERLKRASAESGMPVGEIIRRAIDRELPGSDEQRRAAALRLLATPSMPVPGDPSELEAEILAARGL